MAHQVEFLEVEDDASPAHSGEGPSEPSEWTSSIFGPLPSCQCEDEDTLLECSACGSFFELDTHCPRC
jgi:hypothetical protein